MNITKNSLINSIYTLLSQFTGFFRDIFLASFLGTGIASNMFIVALKIPMSFQRSFSGETFNSAFIPTLHSVDGARGEFERMQFAKNILLLSIFFLVPLIVIVEVNMPYLLSVISPSFTDNPEFNSLLKASRITFPYVTYIILSSVLIGLLNYKNKFSISASMPIIVNIIIIISILYFTDRTNTQKVETLSWAFLVGGLMQFFTLAGLTNREFWKTPHNFTIGIINIKKFFNLIFPTFLSSAFLQINVLFGIFFASFFDGAVSYIYFADRVFMFPVMLTGVSIATVLIPTLSKKIRENKITEALNNQNMAYKLVIATTFPATIILIMLSQEIIHFIFQRGEFIELSTSNTSRALTLLTLGLPFVCLSGILRPYFFAREMPTIPFRISILSVVLNIIITMLLLPKIGYLAIPLAISISSALTLFLYYKKHRDNNFFSLSLELLNFTKKHFLFCLIITFEIFFIKQQLFDLDLQSWKILAVSILVVIFTYIILISKFNKDLLVDLRSLTGFKRTVV